MAAFLCCVWMVLSQDLPTGPAIPTAGKAQEFPVTPSLGKILPSIPPATIAPAGEAIKSPRLLMAVDGAGQFFTCSNACLRACMEHFPDVDVRAMLWSHGYRRYVADQRDLHWAKNMGSRLASQIMAWKQANPNGRVYLLGHSAGCGIALHAASELPPDTLEKVAVMLPSCSTNVDLIGAIRATKYGVHVWHSDQDWVILGLMVRMFGCQDDTTSWRAAGRYGFEPKPITAEEKTLVQDRLRHYPWNETHKRLGNDGGHYGAYRSPFLEMVVLPNLFHANVEPPYPVIEKVQELP